MEKTPGWQIGLFLGVTVVGAVGYAYWQYEIEPRQRRERIRAALAEVEQEAAALQKEKPSAAPPAPDVRPVLDVTAGSLFAQYRDNEVAADAEYRGRSLRVSGRVASVGNGLLDDEMVVRLRVNEFSTVDATMAPTEKAAVMTLKKGYSVVLLCVGNSATVGIPQLAGCQFNSPPTPPARRSNDFDSELRHHGLSPVRE